MGRLEKALFVVAAVLLTTRSARANDRWALQMQGDMSFSLNRGKADMKMLGEGLTELRYLADQEAKAVPLPSTFGLHGGFDLIYRDRFIFPTLGVAVGVPIGAHDDVLTSIDGSMLRVRSSTTLMTELQFAGIGLRLKERRWVFSLAVRPAVVLTFTDGLVAMGRDEEKVRLGGITMALRGDIQVCRRLDPDNRVCLFAAPKFYEWKWWGGAAFGVRWEWGP